MARVQAYQSLRIFYALSDALSSLHNPEPVLRNALEAFRAHLNASQICIYTPDPERSGQLIESVCVGMPSPSPTDQVRWEGSIWIRQALERGELWLKDCRAQFPEAPYQAIALLPLQADGTFLGLLEIAWATPRVLDESLRAMVKRAASILTSGMLNIHLWKQLQERVRQLEALNRALEQALVAREQMIQQVRDEGIGIHPEALPRVFEPFYQVDGSTTRKFGGIGIGLAAVKQIAEAHGGRVEIQSEPGRGTCVSLWLPTVRT